LHGGLATPIAAFSAGSGSCDPEREKAAGCQPAARTPPGGGAPRGRWRRGGRSTGMKALFVGRDREQPPPPATHGACVRFRATPPVLPYSLPRAGHMASTVAGGDERRGKLPRPCAAVCACVWVHVPAAGARVGRRLRRRSSGPSRCRSAWCAPASHEPWSGRCGRFDRLHSWPTAYRAYKCSLLSVC
jgi:hypothetical protein